MKAALLSVPRSVAEICEAEFTEGIKNYLIDLRQVMNLVPDYAMSMGRMLLLLLTIITLLSREFR